jgi:CBS domain-containing protein
MEVKELLEEKGRQVYTVGGEVSVDDAIKQMSQKRISALIVVADEQPEGIFTERDVVRCYLKFPGKPFTEVTVREVMTDRLIVAELTDGIRDAVAMMIQTDIRHLPVVQEGRVVGMLSLRDLVHQLVGSLTTELHYLQDYITDLQDANID